MMMLMGKDLCRTLKVSCCEYYRVYYRENTQVRTVVWQLYRVQFCLNDITFTVLLQGVEYE